jgi:hypothetical protein
MSAAEINAVIPVLFDHIAGTSMFIIGGYYVCKVVSTWLIRLGRDD